MQSIIPRHISRLMHSGEYESMSMMFGDHMHLFRAVMVDLSTYFLERDILRIPDWEDRKFREELKIKLSEYPSMELSKVYNNNMSKPINGNRVDTVMRYIFNEAYGSAIYIDDVLYFKTEQDMLVFTLRFC